MTRGHAGRPSRVTMMALGTGSQRVDVVGVCVFRSRPLGCLEGCAERLNGPRMLHRARVLRDREERDSEQYEQRPRVEVGRAFGPERAAEAGPGQSPCSVGLTERRARRGA